MMPDARKQSQRDTLWVRINQIYSVGDRFIMPIQAQWDEYEVALLIEAYLEIKKDYTRKKETLLNLSNSLRQRAINMGYTIDEEFRNFNGMLWQETYIDKAFNKTRFEARTPSALFQKMVDMYTNNPEKFNRILSEAKKQVNGKEERPSFSEWLTSKYGNRYSAQFIIVALNEANQYAITRKLTKVELTATDNPTVFLNVIKSILTNRFFRITHLKSAKLLDKTAHIYCQYLKENTAYSKPKETETTHIEPPKTDESEKKETAVVSVSPVTSSDSAEALLKTAFPYGIRLGSVRDIMRFRLAAEEAQIALPEDDEVLKRELMQCGTILDDKLFAKSENMADELRSKVEAIFADGFVIIYYEALFYSEQEWMERHHISSDDILKDVLKRELTDYNYTRVFFTKDEKKTEYEAVSEELKRVWGENAVAEIRELSKNLPFVPLDNIQRVLFAAPHFVWVSEGNYLLIDRIIVSDHEAEDIIEYVTTSCKENGYASLTDIPLGCIAENNAFVSGNALYTAIYNKLLKDRFHNNGKILTTGRSTMSIVSILSREFRDREEVSFDEVNNKVTELNGGSKRQDTFEILYTNFVRISEKQFVSPKKVHFDVEETDQVLSGIYKNGFGAIRDVTTFAMFPICGVSWNLYVLESYCHKYSHKYYLSVLNYNSKNAGIIAEKKLRYTHDQMLAIALARSKEELTEEAAGEFFFQQGLMAKRTYAKLPDIVKKAELLRKEE